MNKAYINLWISSEGNTFILNVASEMNVTSYHICIRKDNDDGFLYKQAFCQSIGCWESPKYLNIFMGLLS